MFIGEKIIPESIQGKTRKLLWRLILCFSSVFFYIFVLLPYFFQIFALDFKIMYVKPTLNNSSTTKDR